MMNKFDENAKKQLDELGYVIFENVLSEEEVEKVRNIVLELAEWEKKTGEAEIYGENNQRIWNLLNKGKVFLDYLQYPFLLDAMEYLLGEDVILSSWSVNLIGPGGHEGHMHADVPLGMLPDPLPAMPLTANSIWLLDDFTEENGATRAVPGTHHSLRNPKPEDVNHPDRVLLTAKKGSVIVFNGAMWHGSGPNHTDRARIALLGYFCRSFIRPMEDWQRIVDQEIIDQLSPKMKKLIGVGYGARKGALIPPPAHLR